MTNTLSLLNPKQGELVCPFLNSEFSPQQLEAFVAETESKNIESLDVCFVNDAVFERYSAIYRLDGQWIFWHGHLDKPMSWNWHEDIEALINDDTDVNDLNENWNCLNLTEIGIDNDALVKRKAAIKTFLEHQNLPKY